VPHPAVDLKWGYRKQSLNCGVWWTSNRRFGFLEESLSTVAISRAFNGFHDGVRLRVNIPPRSGEIPMSGQVSKGVGVHVSRPPGQTGMPEGIEREGCNLRQLACPRMLLLQA
jgi:hypothetical protein